jgi:hypothetical protein
MLRFPVLSEGAEHLVMGNLMRRNILTYKAPPMNEAAIRLKCERGAIKSKLANKTAAKLSYSTETRFLMRRRMGFLELTKLLLLFALALGACIVMMIIPFLLLDAIQGIDQKMGISCFVFTKIISLRQAVLLVLLVVSNLLTGLLYYQTYTQEKINNFYQIKGRTVLTKRFIWTTSVVFAIIVCWAYELMELGEMLDTRNCS